MRIDHDEDPGKSAIFAIALLLSSAIRVAVAYLFRASVPLISAIAAAAGVAAALLLILDRRRGVILIRDAEWCIAWRFFKTQRFARQLPLSQYSEVILHAEQRFRDSEDVNPYAERGEASSLTPFVSTAKRNSWRFDRVRPRVSTQTCRTRRQIHRPQISRFHQMTSRYDSLRQPQKAIESRRSAGTFLN